jgi:hypothetical protein
MRSFARFTATAATVVAAGFLVVPGVGLAATTPPSPSGSTGPMAPTTVNYYSASTLSSLYTPSGQAVANPSAAPSVGDYLVSTGNDYIGTHTAHSANVTATDHLFCLFTKAPATATCAAQIATSQGMIFADNSVQNFAAQSQSQIYRITGGTGAYQGAKGSVTVTPIAGGHNADFTVTWSK